MAWGLFLSQYKEMELRLFLCLLSPAFLLSSPSSGTVRLGGEYWAPRGPRTRGRKSKDLPFLGLVWTVTGKARRTVH